MCGLLLRQNRWLDRAYAALQLYPDNDPESARAALRQSIYRLQRWLGEGAIEATVDHLRLRSPWAVEVQEVGGELDDELAHPWLVELRAAALSVPKDDKPSPHAAFIDLVSSASKIDPDEGRALLVAGRNRLWHLRREEVLALLGATRPTRADAPNAALYLEVRGGYEYRIGQLAASHKTYMRALRLAQNQGQSGDARSIASNILFGLAEAGMSRTANAWLDQLIASGASDLLIRHGLAACAWNEGRLEEALTIYEAARPLLQATGRQERLHFWVNYAVASAEAGHLDRCAEGQEMLLRESLTPGDVRIHENLAYAKGWAALKDRNPGEAIRRLSGMQPGNWELHALYKVEALAVAYGSAGELPQARRSWQAMRSMKTKFGAPQNERRRRIERQLVGLVG